MPGAVQDGVWVALTAGLPLRLKHRDRADPEGGDLIHVGQRPRAVDDHRQAPVVKHLRGAHAQLVEEHGLRHDLVHVDQIGEGLDAGQRFGGVQRHELAIGHRRAVEAGQLVVVHPPVGAHVEAPLGDVLNIKAGVAGMAAVGVLGQQARRFQERVPVPDLVILEVRRLHAGLFEQLLVEEQVIGRPGGADPEPVSLAVRGALDLLRLDEVIRLAQLRIALHKLGEVHQQAVMNKRPVLRVADERRIGRRPGGDIRQELLVIVVRCVHPGDPDLILLGLEYLDSGADAFIFCYVAPPHERDRGGALAVRGRKSRAGLPEVRAGGGRRSGNPHHLDEIAARQSWLGHPSSPSSCLAYARCGTGWIVFCLHTADAHHSRRTIDKLTGGWLAAGMSSGISTVPLAEG